MVENEAIPDSFKYMVGEKAAFFYADYDIITFTNPVRLQ